MSNEQQLKEKVRLLEMAILDALSIAEMEGRDFSMEPWASLQAAVEEEQA
ncbi:hypothetical protein [Paenibacillus sp. D9]|nr:hypothetical protein [Paenibacillus sp. D9]